MKKDIHPTMYPTIIVDVSCGEEFKTLSTVETGETREEDGVTYQVLRMDITSASHPFFTGKQAFIDTAGRLERFKEKTAKAEQLQTDRKHKSKKEKRQARSKKTKSTKGKAKEALKAAKAALSED